MSNNQLNITVTQPSSIAPQADSVALTTGLQSLQQSLFSAAEQNIDVALGDQAGAFSALSRRAMVVTEALRLTSGMDLSTIIMRGQIIKQIEDEGLTGVHPNGYANLTKLAEDNGVSVGEFSDIRALVEVIFPYIVSELGMNLVEVWEQIGKSSFREMVPALRSLITGEQADHNSVRTAVEQMMNGSAASLLADEQNPWTQEELATEEGGQAVRQRAVASLLQDGMTMPTRDLRRRVRPSRVPAVQMATLQTAESQWYAVLKLETLEQRDLVLRVLNSHSNNMNLEARGRQHEQLRDTLGSFFTSGE
jgi:hypothetical protein